MQKYPNPPITEAVLELKVTASEGLTLAKLEQIHQLVPNYPIKKTRQQIENIFTGGENPTSETKKSDTGFFFVSGDGKQVFQAGLDNFSFSRVNPYQGWDKFAKDARTLWQTYKQATSPLAVTRIGLRFINRLDLPWPFDDFKEYLRTSPEVSPDMSQMLSNFLMVLENPQPDIKAVMRLSETILPPAVINTVAVLLDIDLYRFEELPFDDDLIWENLEQLRQRKNQIFEACITDKARELFK